MSAIDDFRVTMARYERGARSFAGLPYVADILRRICADVCRAPEDAGKEREHLLFVVDALRDPRFPQTRRVVRGAWFRERAAAAIARLQAAS